MVIAIDGPAAAGKSTVARAAALALGFTYLDSGAMYRAAALVHMERGGPPGRRAAELAIEVGDRVTADGRDVTEAIRAPAVAEAASQIAADRTVRAALVEKQRTLLAVGNWVAEGRDIGTVVAPDADVKVFLTAEPGERARRRARELGADWRTVLADQTLRDEQDRSRPASPLRAAPDAVELDTTGRPVEDVVGQVVRLVDEARGRGRRRPAASGDPGP